MAIVLGIAPGIFIAFLTTRAIGVLLAAHLELRGHR